MKKFTLIVLLTFLIIRIDIWECKCFATVKYNITDTSHPLRQITSLIESELVQVRKKIPNINLGGCGVFAYELKKILDPLNVKTSILIIDEDHEYCDKKNYLNQVVNLNMKTGYMSTAVNHVILMIDELGVAIDASGVHCISFKQGKPYTWHGLYIVGEYTMKELEYAAYNSNWNQYFNRRRIPELKYYLSLIKDKIEGKRINNKTLSKLVRTRMFWQVVEAPIRFIKLYLS